MTATKTVRCGAIDDCKHYQTKHVEARGKMPAYCMSCKGAKALHKYGTKVAA